MFTKDEMGRAFMWALCCSACCCCFGAHCCDSCGPKEQPAAPKNLDEVVGKPEANPLRGQVYVITGANTGIGKQVAKRLYGWGASVVIGCRDTTKGEAAIADIKSAVTSTVGQLECVALDLSDFDTVDNFAATVMKKFPRVDVLVCNAGSNLPAHNDKYNCQALFVTNYLGHFRLFHQMLPALQSRTVSVEGTVAPATARVVTTSSVMHHMGQRNARISVTGAYPTNAPNSCPYSDTKLYMNFFAMAVNHIYDNEKPYASESLIPAVKNAQRNTEKRSIVAVSVNPGAVASDIWRHGEQEKKDPAMKHMEAQFLPVEEGSACTTYASVVGLDTLRNYQKSVASPEELKKNSSGTEDKGTVRLKRRADLPYVIPYDVRGKRVSQEIYGPFHGPNLASVSMPEYTDDDLTRISSVQISDDKTVLHPAAVDLWFVSLALSEKFAAGGRMEDGEEIVVNTEAADFI